MLEEFDISSTGKPPSLLSLPLPLKTLSYIARSVSLSFSPLRFGFLPKHWCPFFSTYNTLREAVRPLSPEPFNEGRRNEQ